MTDFQSKRLGKYLLLEQIAVGGMARLYRAKITGVEGFEKLIAIKTILPHLAEEKELVSSFIDEAKLAALLNHQNIVQIYDFGSMENSYFISMEFLFGKDIRIIAKKAGEKGMGISLEDALYIMSRICSGLQYAHTLKDFQGKPLNIIHRDISPQNVIITYEGDVKIVDFGIAKAASQSSVTQHGMIKGKISYMSPEQAAGKSIDYRSDIFSAGIIFYEMVTGHKMFTGESTMQILARVRDVQYAPAEEYVTDVPKKLSVILGRALAKEPDDRYQSCGDMLSDLEECMIEHELRPTATGLSQYMKKLFEEEIALEYEHIREFSSVEEEVQPEPIFTEEPLKAIPPKREVPKEAPVSEKKEAPKKAMPLNYQYAAIIVVIVVLVGASFILWPGEEKVPEPEEIVSVETEVPAPPTPREKAESVETEVPAPPPREEPKPDLEREKADFAREREDISNRVSELLSQASGLIATEPGKAETLLIEAIKLDPGNVESYNQLGRTYVTIKNYPKSIEAYTKATELDADFPDAFFNLGYVYAVMKDYPKAETMYSMVVEKAPPYLDEALFNLAMVQDKQGKRDQCIANLERAVMVNPDNQLAKKYLDKLKK
jgi:serine/threonine protein kinase